MDIDNHIQSLRETQAGNQALHDAAMAQIDAALARIDACLQRTEANLAASRESQARTHTFLESVQEPSCHPFLETGQYTQQAAETDRRIAELVSAIGQYVCKNEQQNPNAQ